MERHNTRRCVQARTVAACHHKQPWEQPPQRQAHLCLCVPGRSAFNLGHTVSNFYGGVLAASYSPKSVLTVGVLVWSAFTLATPPAAALGTAPLYLARALMGLGEGVAYPTMQVRLEAAGSCTSVLHL